MKHFLFSTLLLGCVATASLFSATAMADQPQTIHYSGQGLFLATNIGNTHGGNVDFLIGDGTGASQYVASGSDFTIGGQLVGDGHHEQSGEVISWTSGILKAGQDVVRWPGKSGENHVIRTEEGDIEFQYSGEFKLDLTTGSFTADPLFIIVGGTGRFEGASGVLSVDVAVPFPVSQLPPPGVSPPIPFDFEANGFIVLEQ